MRQLVWAGPGREDSFLRNPHFWAIVFISLAITIIYYLDIIYVDFHDPNWQWLWHLRIFEYSNDLTGVLFCIPFVYAALIFWWRGILAIWLYSMAVMVPLIRFYTDDPLSLAINIIYLLIPLLVVLIIALQRKWREVERKAMAERDKQRQACIAQVFAAQEDERGRISREIHDDTTQRLWVVANQTQKLISSEQASLSRETVAELETIKDTIQKISEDARRLSLALRPGILDDLGLVPAMRWLLDQLNGDGKTTARLVVRGKERTLDNDTSNHLFRITQEALNNVRRHSGADRVVVTLDFGADTVRTTVEDNGVGFTFREAEGHLKQGELGIIGIQERARLLNGVVKVTSKGGKGTVLSLEFAA